MSLRRPMFLSSRLLRTTRTAQQAQPLVSSPFRRTLSSSQQLRSAEGSHEEHYDPPGGWLFGVKPGEKYQNEGWEGIWVYGFFGSLALGVVGYCYKPDTSIQTWALEEARRRLEAEGILQDPDTKTGNTRN